MSVRPSTPAALTAALIAGLVAALSASAGEMKFANYMAPTHPYVEGCFQPFADRIAETTGGAATVKLYNGGELGAGPAEQYGRVVDGVAEFAVSLPGYTASNFPLTLLAELPGVTDAATGALGSISMKVGAMQAADLALDALSLGSIYFLAAIGLAITFGVMGIINMAHGEMVMIGAYSTFMVQEVIRSSFPGLFDWSLAIALPVGVVDDGVTHQRLRV